jgi:hypothetical protein
MEKCPQEKKLGSLQRGGCVGDPNIDGRIILN